MAYVLGFFSADGCITVNQRGSHYFVLQIGDKELLEEIRRSLDSEHKITKRIHAKYQSIFYRLQIGSKEMCDDLRKIGLTENKTYSMSVPLVPSKYFPDFVRGYFDGDGNVWAGMIHKDRKSPSIAIQVAFTSCSREFLEGIKQRLVKYGVIGGAI